jgi:hypothetical protein
MSIAAVREVTSRLTLSTGVLAALGAALELRITDATVALSSPSHITQSAFPMGLCSRRVHERLLHPCDVRSCA